jgi:hypothetical protein
MSGVCHDCPGAVGCCYTNLRHRDEEDEPMEADEFVQELLVPALMWMFFGCIAFAASGVLFLIGAFCFRLGLALLR